MILKPEAEADLAEAADYYDGRRDGLGDEFLRAVDVVLRRIDSQPELHAVTYQDVRRALVRRFPFVVYYRIEAGDVVIFAIVHSRRDPKHWQSRI